MICSYVLLLIASAVVPYAVDSFSPLYRSQLSSSSVTIFNRIAFTSTVTNTGSSLSAGKSDIHSDKNSAGISNKESSVSGIVQWDGKTISPVKFDLSLAVILAGYSFEAYNEPSILGKVAYGLDGTNITFTSSEYVQRVFSGALVVTLRQGSFKLKEEGLLESVLTGGDPDPYVLISVLEDEYSTPPDNIASKLFKMFTNEKKWEDGGEEKKVKKSSFARVLDSGISEKKDNNPSPTWDESFYLYVKDPSTALLSFTAMDRDLFKEDDCLGCGSISVKELQEESRDNSAVEGVPVPLYLDIEAERERMSENKKNNKNNQNNRSGRSSVRASVGDGWPAVLNMDSFFGRNKMKRTGTLKVNVQFIPWVPFKNQAPKIPKKRFNKNSIFNTEKDNVGNKIYRDNQADIDGIENKPILDFFLSKDGVSQALARDLELKFRRLPSGASPGLVDWAELTSNLIRKMPLENQKSVKKSLENDIKLERIISSGSNGLGGVGGNDGVIMTIEVNRIVENKIKNEINTIIEDERGSGELERGSEELERGRERGSEEGETDGEGDKGTDEEETREEELERHHRISNGIIEGRALSQICCLDNEETDTQASIWADFTHKQVIVSFRGTEQVKFKDILTDINMIQVAYEESNEDLATLMVHKGFMDAFRSVRPALLQVIHSLLLLPSAPISPLSSSPSSTPSPLSSSSPPSSSATTPSPSSPSLSQDNLGNNLTNTPENTQSTDITPEQHWHIYVTGHSLGGALASLFTFELGRIQAGLWGSGEESLAKTKEKNEKNKDKKKTPDLPQYTVDPASVYREDGTFLSALRSADVTMYSYGAPRTGSPLFSKMFDELIPDSYRIVNDKDIVPRIPRSSKTNRFLQYEHVGKTVMISGGKNDSNEVPLGVAPVVLWVQGEGDISVPCPIADLSPFQESTVPVPFSSPFDLTGNYSSDAMVGLLGQGVNVIYNQFEEQQQVFQQQLLDQMKEAIGADAFAAASDTTNSASKMFQCSFAMISGKYNEMNAANEREKEKEREKERQIKERNDKIFFWNKKNDKDDKNDKNDKNSKNSNDEKKEEVSIIKPVAPDVTVEVLSAQFISMALQATGLSPQGLSQLLILGESVSGLSTAASDMTKGFTSEFIEREMELLNAIIDGKAIEHHLEPSYYKALSYAAEYLKKINAIKDMEKNGVMENVEDIKGNE